MCAFTLYAVRLRVLGRLADWPTSLAPSICLAFVLIVLRAVLRVLGYIIIKYYTLRINYYC